MDLVEKVARAIGGDPDREPYYVNKAKAAIAVVLKHQLVWSDKTPVALSDSRTIFRNMLNAYARENGVSLIEHPEQPSDYPASP